MIVSHNVVVHYESAKEIPDDVFCVDDNVERLQHLHGSVFAVPTIEEAKRVAKMVAHHTAKDRRKPGGVIEVEVLEEGIYESFTDMFGTNFCDILETVEGNAQ